MSVEQAMLLGDNFSTGFFCADQADIRREAMTVVLGCGAVGLSAIAAARYLGAETVVAVDGVESRRKRAAELGAIVATPDEAAQCVQELARATGRGGADSVLEAVGLPSAQRLAFEVVRPGGVISAVGMHTSAQFTFSPEDAYNRNLTYRAGRCPVRSYLDRLVREVESGSLTIPVSQIVTHAQVPLSDGPDAYRRFSQREEDCVKILLDPRGE
jgi:threonine dehydrogenase-like Zn-dependent dehydrogenase